MQEAKVALKIQYEVESCT